MGQVSLVNLKFERCIIQRFKGARCYGYANFIGISNIN